MNEPMTATSAMDRLVEAVRRELLAAELAEGELFMTEEALCRRHGVTRGVAREAISRLQALGVLRGRQRKGLVMGRPHPARLLGQCLPFMLQREPDVRQLAHFRYVLETGAIELAALYATPDQIAQMMALVADWERYTRDGATVPEGFATDAAFHCLILTMAGVELLSHLHQVIVDYFAQTRWAAAAWPEHMDRHRWQHRAIAEAIASHDVEQARAQLRLHIAYLRDLPPRPPRETAP